MPLLAADEPIIFDGQTGGRKRKRASRILLRRTKQGVDTFSFEPNKWCTNAELTPPAPRWRGRSPP